MAQWNFGRTVVISVVLCAGVSFLPGCNTGEASASKENQDLRKQLQSKPTEEQMKEALAKAPPEVRAMYVKNGVKGPPAAPPKPAK